MNLVQLLQNIGCKNARNDGINDKRRGINLSFSYLIGRLIIDSLVPKSAFLPLFS